MGHTHEQEHLQVEKTCSLYRSLRSVEACIGPPDNLGTKASCSSQGPKLIHVCRDFMISFICRKNHKIKVKKLYLYVVD